MFDSEHQMLSITHVGSYHVVIVKPAYRRGDVNSHLSDDLTVSQSAPCRELVREVLRSVRACMTLNTGS